MAQSKICAQQHFKRKKNVNRRLSIRVEAKKKIVIIDQKKKRKSVQYTPGITTESGEVN